MEELNTTCSEDELVRELLDDVSPFFVLPPEINESKSSSDRNESSINKLMSTLYSGPTVQDIDSALSVTNYKHHFQDIAQARFSIIEKGMSKVDNNKYTLKMKSCGDALADDGYKWRKYGQKSIKNSPNPRSYYRCTNPRCSAKKQVERSTYDPDTFLVTYEGLHLHFAYPFFLGQPEYDNPPSKKLKDTAQQAQAQAHEAQQTRTMDCPEFVDPDLLPSPFVDHQLGLAQEEMAPQGLLEDMVPLMIRNPTNNIFSSSSCSSYPSSPSSLSWSP